MNHIQAYLNLVRSQVCPLPCNNQYQILHQLCPKLDVNLELIKQSPDVIGFLIDCVVSCVSWLTIEPDLLQPEWISFWNSIISESGLPCHPYLIRDRSLFLPSTTLVTDLGGKELTIYFRDEGNFDYGNPPLGPFGGMTLNRREGYAPSPNLPTIIGTYNCISGFDPNTWSYHFQDDPRILILIRKYFDKFMRPSHAIYRPPRPVSDEFYLVVEEIEYNQKIHSGEEAHELPDVNYSVYEYYKDVVQWTSSGRRIWSPTGFPSHVKIHTRRSGKRVVLTKDLYEDYKRWGKCRMSLAEDRIFAIDIRRLTTRLSRTGEIISAIGRNIIDGSKQSVIDLDHLLNPPAPRQVPPNLKIVPHKNVKNKRGVPKRETPEKEETKFISNPPTNYSHNQWLLDRLAKIKDIIEEITSHDDRRGNP